MEVLEKSSVRAELLEKLGVKEANYGSSTGTKWNKTTTEGELKIYSPTNGEFIGSVYQASEEDYEKIITESQKAFKYWIKVPAPKRGELVRQIGNRLRDYKRDLGTLVSYEMGKSLQEGMGEVQEMIDICDFAVGLSRQLYGLNMHSERPQHRMYEQWHPLGPVGVITSFNFPVAVWAWNAAIAAVCGDPVVWKPSLSTVLCGVAVQRIANGVMSDHGLDGVFTFVAGSGRTVGEMLLADPRVPLISFTGSTRAGNSSLKWPASRTAAAR